jgi:hypothetical protein
LLGHRIAPAGMKYLQIMINFGLSRTLGARRAGV